MVPSDASLLAGGARDFAEFYRRYEDAILSFFLRRVGSAEVSLDLTAETFARALESRDRFDPSLGAAGAWLFGIARHVLAASVKRGFVDDTMRRRLGMEPLVMDDASLARIEALGDEPAVRALDALPERQREAVVGHVVGERSYAELAADLRCSESVVRQRVSRGLRSLRRTLEAER